MSDFSTRFTELRKEHGYTQETIADALGVSRSIIGMYETGKRYPSYEGQEAIADFFNVDLDYLAGKSEIKNKYSEDIVQSNPKLIKFRELVSKLSDEDIDKVYEIAKLLLMAENNKQNQ